MIQFESFRRASHPVGSRSPSPLSPQAAAAGLPWPFPVTEALRRAPAGAVCAARRVVVRSAASSFPTCASLLSLRLLLDLWLSGAVLLGALPPKSARPRLAGAGVAGADLVGAKRALLVI